MQLQIYTNIEKETFKRELKNSINNYDNKLVEKEEAYLRRYKNPMEAITNFVLDEKSLMNTYERLLEEEVLLNIDLKKQNDFLNSPPQFKEHKYINANGECVTIYQGSSIPDEESEDIQEENQDFVFFIPPDPAIEENRILLN